MMHRFGVILFIWASSGCFGVSYINDKQLLSSSPSILICDQDITTGFGGGLGTAEDPFRICNFQQWKSWAVSGADLDKYIKLETDLDFSMFTETEMIGAGAVAFSGVFDGNGKILSNLSLTSLAVPFSIFKNATGNAQIKNLVLRNFAITNSERSAGLVLDHTAGVLRLENIQLENIVINISTALANIGGLVGASDGLEILGLTVTGLELNFMVLPDRQIGGLVGHSAGSKAELNNIIFNGLRLTQVSTSFANGGYFGGFIGRVTSTQLTITNSQNNSFYFGFKTSSSNGSGGLIGKIEGPATSFRIENVRSSGQFALRSGYSGGLIGYTNIGPGATSEIINSSFLGQNDREAGRNPIGGLIGVSDGILEIKNSYMIGDMHTLDSTIGGLVGQNVGTLEIEDSHAAGTFSSADIFVGTVYMGGLVGGSYDTTIIRRSYFSGGITFSNDVPVQGCLVGGVIVGTLTINDGYFDSSRCVSNAVSSGAYAGAAGLATAALQTAVPFVNWLPAVWNFSAGSDPKLIWEP